MHTPFVAASDDVDTLYVPTLPTLVGEKSYTVRFMSKSQLSGTTGFGRLLWSDRKHSVGSPIAFRWT